MLIRSLVPFALAAMLAAQPAVGPQRAKVDQIFARFNHTDSPGCTVAVSLRDEPVLQAAYGMADLEHGIALTPDSILEAGSVSKQFTAAALLLLAQAGRISLDDPARKYIPELPLYGAPITIRHLIHHTSGLRDWGSVAAIAGWERTTRVHTHAHVLEIVKAQKALNYDPGDAYSYTNTGYNLAAILVSRVSIQPFAEFTRARIFEPLGMTSTSWRDDFRRIVPRRAVAYRPAGDGFEQLMPFENVHGNGGLLTTAGDLLRWNRNFTDAKVGGKAFVEEQHRRAVLNNGRQITYAAGLTIDKYRGVMEVSHSGATAGYRAWLARYPEQHVGVAVLCNTTSANAPQLGRAVAAVFVPFAEAARPAASSNEGSLYRNRRTFATRRFAKSDGTLQIETPNGPEYWDRVEAWTPKIDEIASFAGEYRSEEAGVTWRIVADNGAVTVHRGASDSYLLKPTVKDSFENQDLGAIRFLRGSDGAVNELAVSEARVWDLRFKRVR
jgi:CubicO group peptidase (beta-lactamase class C family)